MTTFKRLLLLIAFLALTTSAFAVDTYWIGFNGTGGVFKYLMQIDQNGKILKPATAVLSYDLVKFSTTGDCTNGTEPCNPYAQDSNAENDPKGPLDGPVAMALQDNGSSQISVWMLTVQGSIFRLDVDKATVKGIQPFPVIVVNRAKKSTKSLDFRTFAVTQHVSNRFLAVSRIAMGADDCSGPCFDNPRKAVYTRYPVTAGNGVDTVNVNRISPRTDNGHKAGNVSADGLMAVSWSEDSVFDDSCCGGAAVDNDFANKIYVQPLTAGGNATGTPFVFGPSPQTVDMGAIDVSNPLTGGKRFVVFSTRSLDDPDSSNGDFLKLQIVDAVTGQSLGSTTLLSDQEMVMTMFNTIAVDPKGRFVIYTQRPTLSTAPGTTGPSDEERDSLYYLGLDSNGNAVGKPIKLYSSDAGPQTGKEDENNGKEFAWPQITDVDILQD